MKNQFTIVIAIYSILFLQGCKPVRSGSEVQDINYNDAKSGESLWIYQDSGKIIFKQCEGQTFAGDERESCKQSDKSKIKVFDQKILRLALRDYLTLPEGGLTLKRKSESGQDLTFEEQEILKMDQVRTKHTVARAIEFISAFKVGVKEGSLSEAEGLLRNQEEVFRADGNYNRVNNAVDDFIALIVDPGKTIVINDNRSNQPGLNLAVVVAAVASVIFFVGLLSSAALLIADGNSSARNDLIKSSNQDRFCTRNDLRTVKRGMERYGAVCLGMDRNFPMWEKCTKFPCTADSY